MTRTDRYYNNQSFRPVHVSSLIRARADERTAVEICPCASEDL